MHTAESKFNPIHYMDIQFVVPDDDDDDDEEHRQKSLLDGFCQMHCY